MTRRCVILILFFFSPFVRADTIVLKDGTRVDGTLKRVASGYDVTAANGTVTHVNSGDIGSIQLGKASSSGGANDKFGSLKRSVESLDDLNQIIARYTAFIEQNKTSPAAADAKKELAIWQDRQAKGMVKVGGNWVTPQVQEELLSHAGEVVRKAFDLMRQNQLKAAEPVLKKALEVDPTNPAANYMEGVQLFLTDRIVPARKAFEATHAQMPGDAATLNNLGVIAWRQNQYLGALSFYSDAMLARPANKEILSNVAEALAALKDDMKKSPVAERASRLFVGQEAQLEASMAQYGWYRWGSMWVDQKQLDELKKLEQAIKEKADAMQKQFDDLQKRYRDNEDQIRRFEQIKEDIAQANTIVDPKTGTVYRNPYPQSYWDADRDIQRLQSDNNSIDVDISTLRQDAARLEATKPKPKFNGVQNLIGVEGTPRVGGLAVAIAPAQPGNPATAAVTQPTSTTAPATAPATATTAGSAMSATTQSAITQSANQPTTAPAPSTAPATRPSTRRAPVIQPTVGATSRP